MSAGRFYWLYQFQELAKQRFSVTAIDPSQDMITIATRHTDIYAGFLEIPTSWGIINFAFL